MVKIKVTFPILKEKRFGHIEFLNAIIIVPYVTSLTSLISGHDIFNTYLKNKELAYLRRNVRNNSPTISESQQTSKDESASSTTGCQHLASVFLLGQNMPILPILI